MWARLLRPCDPDTRLNKGIDSMKKSALAFALSACLAGNAFAIEGNVPRGVTPLDHVFVIMMENQAYQQIKDNTNAPFINQYMSEANQATNYFGVGHPSLTNYLEIVGGSNFGIQSDHSPDWHAGCAPNIMSGVVDNESAAHPNVCPIYGEGTDAATPAVDSSNEGSPYAPLLNIDGTKSVPAANTTGKSIADQLVAAGRTWKSYQEALPAEGADRVNFSDGFYTNNTDFSTFWPVVTGLDTSNIVQLYAVKHNPFAYFRSVQEGQDDKLSLKNSVGFDGPNGLYADLRDGKVPAFSFIAPNQCNDQHGRGNAGPFCAYNPVSDGMPDGVNPALIQRGDATLEKLVDSIHSSPVWKRGHNAIVVVWDENDYSAYPNINQVVMIVDTNYGKHGVTSNTYYNHFSLLKTLEAGFKLPCLNHACDNNVPVMSDLFAN
jgi:hypothetical protein